MLFVCIVKILTMFVLDNLWSVSLRSISGRYGCSGMSVSVVNIFTVFVFEDL